MQFPSDPVALGKYDSTDTCYTSTTHHVDDFIGVEHRAEATAHRSQVTEDLFLAMFNDTTNLQKAPRWSTELKLLGLVVNTVQGTVSLPPDKVAKIMQQLQQYPPTRQRASITEIKSLLGVLRSVAMMVPSGRTFLAQLQRVESEATARARASHAGPALTHGRLRPTGPQAVLLDAEAHQNLEWWRYIVPQSTLHTVSLSSATFRHVRRAAMVTSFTDAARFGMGGYCPQLKKYVQLQWPPDIQARYNDNAADNTIYANDCELCGMFIAACMWLIICKLRCANERALLWGDNMTALARINKPGHAISGVTADFARLFGVLEMHTGMSIAATHIAGVDNVAADALSRALVTDTEKCDAATLLPGYSQLQIPEWLSSTACNVLRGSCGWAAMRTALVNGMQAQ